MKRLIIHDPERLRQATRSSEGRRRRNKTFVAVCVITASLSLCFLAVLLLSILIQGAPSLDWGFLTNPPEQDPEEAGVFPAVIGTVWVCGICAVLTLPLGVATAIFLEEYQPQSWMMKKLHSFVQLNITNLAGVPSVVYGILGLTVFAQMFGLLGNSNEPVVELGAEYFYQFVTEEGEVVFVPVAGPDAPQPALVDGMTAVTSPDGGRTVTLHIVPPGGRLPRDEEARRWTLRHDDTGGIISEKEWYHMGLPLGRSVLAGGLTLMLVVLPILIIAAQEALRGVPLSLKEGAYGLGATQWQTIRKVTLPAAVPGIMTGSLLAMSRAIGEAAPLLMISGIIYIKFAPGNLMDEFTAMPLQIFSWAQES
ncbi:MAG: phosphate ABC transporter permease PstA, partial [Planctomycetes bacterium]|nr:phosphate ABC transporter permease PstA [Planctomycetota bacterium]